MTQLLNRRPQTGPVEIDNRERLVRLVYFLAIVFVLALFTGFSPFLGVIFALVAIVMLHEFGHFVTAKRAGMKVTEYFFGFGPRLWSIRKGETEYGIKAIPLGGYVKIIGMHNLEHVDPADEPRTYRQKSYPRRLSVAFAGSFMHFLLAFVLLMVLWTTVGVPDKVTTQVNEIYKVKGKPSPAQLAGFRSGDQILAVDGRVIAKWQELPPYIQKRPNQPIDFTVQRGNRLLKLTAVPTAEPAADNSDDKIGFVGIGPKIVAERTDLGTAVWRSSKTMGHLTSLTFGAFGTVFSASHLRDYTEQLSGHGAVTGKDADRPISVVGFVRVGGQAVQHGWADFITLLVAINLFVGIFNLAPLLPLDGGHVAIATYERIRSRKGRKYHADVAKLMPLTAAVVTVLLLFGAMTIYLDIFRPIANPFQ
jgi:membrane-associated protease RseP (regulator of RpoE activity)